MGKYSPLGDFLLGTAASEVPLTFGDIERITGVKLPPKAQHHRAWWSNSPLNNVMTRVWLAAGFRSERVDLKARKLVFRRVRNTGTAKAFSSAPAPGGASGRHPLFGALKDITRVPPGVDLTEPADPGWGDLLDADDRRS